MLHPFSKLVSAVVSLGLILTPQLLLASTPRNIPDSSSNTIAQFTRLEINLSRRQVTVYMGTTPVKSYPIAVGRRGWETPTGNFRVAQMLKNPTWIHPFTRQPIKGGHPQNPLGKYWIGFWTDGKNWIGFHGTPNPETVGKAASHGCVRMYNKDIEELFSYVSLGTIVTVLP